MPEKSGFPPRVRGVDAVRLTLPSRVRGTPAVGYFNHCANEGVDAQKTIAMINPARTQAMKLCCTHSFSHRWARNGGTPRSGDTRWWHFGGQEGSCCLHNPLEASSWPA